MTGAWTVHVLTWDELGDAARRRLRAEVDAGLAGAAGTGLVLVDEHAPGLDAATARALVEAAADGRARLGVRPVTDTVKRLRERVVVGTVDRAGLVQVVGPLVVPGGTNVLATLAQTARALGEVVPVEVSHRSVADSAELRVAELSAAAAPRV